jgi:hypothetical protein
MRISNNGAAGRRCILQVCRITSRWSANTNSGGHDAQTHRSNSGGVSVVPLVSEPNRFGPAVVWPYFDANGATQIRCFMPGAGA